MNWTDLKKLIYFEDGSLRDIYVREMNINAWQKWIEFVNSNNFVKFRLDQEYIGNEIDLAAVSKYWSQHQNAFPSATVSLGDILLEINFDDETELELNISPKDIQTIDDHKTLMDHLLNISNLLQKNIEVTIENPAAADEVLLAIRLGEVCLKRSERI